MNTYSRALRHINMKDVKQKHQQKLIEQKIKEQKKKEEQKYIASLMKEKKYDWRTELLREFGEWVPVANAGGPTMGTSSTFGYYVGGFPVINGETGQPITYTASGLGGVEALPTTVTIDQGFGDIANVDAPTYNQLALAGYAPMLPFFRRDYYKDVNAMLDASQEFAQAVGADYMMNARVQIDYLPIDHHIEDDLKKIAAQFDSSLIENMDENIKLVIEAIKNGQWRPPLVPPPDPPYTGMTHAQFIDEINKISDAYNNLREPLEKELEKIRWKRSAADSILLRIDALNKEAMKKHDDLYYRHLKEAQEYGNLLAKRADEWSKFVNAIQSYIEGFSFNPPSQEVAQVAFAPKKVGPKIVGPKIVGPKIVGPKIVGPKNPLNIGTKQANPKKGGAGDANLWGLNSKTGKKEKLSAKDYATYKAGGGDAAAKKGKSIDQIIDQGKKNLGQYDSGPRKTSMTAADFGKDIFGMSNYSAYKAGGGDAAVKSGRTVQQVIDQGKNNLGQLNIGTLSQLAARLLRSFTDSSRFAGDFMFKGLPKGVTYLPDFTGAAQKGLAATLTGGKKWADRFGDFGKALAGKNYATQYFTPSLNKALNYAKTGGTIVAMPRTAGVQGLKNWFGSSVSRGFGIGDIEKLVRTSDTIKSFNQGTTKIFNLADPNSMVELQKLASQGARTNTMLGKLGRAVPFVGAGAAIADVGMRLSKGDYSGAVLGGISAVPGPIGWVGLGAQVLYDTTASQELKNYLNKDVPKFYGLLSNSVQIKGNYLTEQTNDQYLSDIRQSLFELGLPTDKKEYALQQGTLLSLTDVNPELVSIITIAAAGEKFSSEQKQWIENNLIPMIEIFSILRENQEIQIDAKVEKARRIKKIIGKKA